MMPVTTGPMAAALLVAVLALGRCPAADPIEAPATLPAAGTLPWGDDPLARAVLQTPGPQFATMAPVPGPARFPTVIELRTLTVAQPVAEPWAIQASIPSTGAVAKGDAIYVEFWLRTVSSQAESHEGATAVVVEQGDRPWAKTISESASAPADGSWVRRAAAARLVDGYGPGKARLNFHLGRPRGQVIQIGGLRVVDLGPGVDPATLPLPGLTYPGRSLTAAWRAEAARRIDRYRRNDLQVRVVDGAGGPVAGAAVRVEMLRPAFAFGSAVAADALVATGADGDRYRAWIKAHCDQVVIENHLKWGPWEDGLKAKGSPWSRETTLAALGWLRDQGIPTKGHNLIWPSWQFSPTRLRSLAGDEEALARACDEHLADILAATRPYGLVEWDVVNEAFTEKDVYLALGGPMVIDHWFQAARRGFPEGGLLYNDYAHLVQAGEMTPHKRFVEDLVRRLKTSGAPITGLGIQAHIGNGMSDPALVMGELDRLGTDLGVDLHITEFDLNIRDEACQAEYCRDFLTACFASPRVAKVLMWGFWAGRHWLPASALYRQDWSPRPLAKAVEDLVASWHTAASGTTDATGAWSVRGYKGSYRLTVTFADRTITRETAIGDAPTQVVVTR